MMVDESTPWEGVNVPQASRSVAPEAVNRRSPVEERTINLTEVLAGLRGEKLEHAVRFKDLEGIKVEVAKQVGSMSGINGPGSIGAKVAAQFAAIDTESEALLEEYNRLFDQAMLGIETLGTEVDGEFDTFQTALDGNSTSISSLIVSINGVSATYGIRINNNGHISGFGLISSLVAGQAVSDFIINDASLRVVNSSGQGNYTPFAVYPAGRTVNGAFIPAGVHAQDLYVTRASIGDLQVDTLKVAGNAITVPVFATGSTITGNGSLQAAAAATINLGNNLANVYIFWSVKQGYNAGALQWGYQIMDGSTQIDYRVNMGFGNDQPSGTARIASAVTGSRTILFNWIGANSTMTAQVSLQLLARYK
jgi:hypothetical protein